MLDVEVSSITRIIPFAVTLTSEETDIDRPDVLVPLLVPMLEL